MGYLGLEGGYVMRQYIIAFIEFIILRKQKKRGDTKSSSIIETLCVIRH